MLVVIVKQAFLVYNAVAFVFTLVYILFGQADIFAKFPKFSVGSKIYDLRLAPVRCACHVTSSLPYHYIYYTIFSQFKQMNNKLKTALQSSFLSVDGR